MRKFLSIFANIILPVTLLLSCLLYVGVNPVKVAAPNGDSVHNLDTGLNYTTIQGAIDAVETLDGHTLLVDPGTYLENLTIYKSVILKGADRDTTIIESPPYITQYRIVNVTAHNVTITRFTIENSSIRTSSLTQTSYNNLTITDLKIVNCNGSGGAIDLATNNSMISNNEIYYYTANPYAGIMLRYSHSCTIKNNLISGMGGGIGLDYSHNNTVRNNLIVGIPAIPDDAGLIFGHGSNNNTLVGNTIEEQSLGVWILDASTRNVFFHNNFIGNAIQALAHSQNNITIWDNGYPSGGNYWSDYDGNDLFSGPNQDETSSDGIGDIPYVINEKNQDNYPLMYPWPWERTTFNVTYKSTTYDIDTISNSNLTQFGFNWTLQQLSFNVTHSQASGFCSVSIPKRLLDGAFQLLVNDTMTPCKLTWSRSHTFVYFEVKANLEMVKIIGEYVTPIPGDLNGDHVVDIFDAIILANHFGEEDC